jgi:hypothetical protein
VASCILFIEGRGAIETHRLLLYWIVKLVAILFALLASITLTTVWEEWAIWRQSSRPEGIDFLASVLRTNLYVLVLIMAVPAVLILPKRLRSRDFLVQKHHPVVSQEVASPR